MEFRGSVAIITGGASGLGEATARQLVSRGAKVAILDLNPENGRRLQAELGEDAAFFALDVADTDAVDDVVQRVQNHFGLLHVVVNCAGLGGSKKIVSKEGLMPIDWFKNRIDINLIGSFNVIRAAAPYLMENTPNAEGERGVCINTASIAFQVRQRFINTVKNLFHGFELTPEGEEALALWAEYMSQQSQKLAAFIKAYRKIIKH